MGILNQKLKKQLENSNITPLPNHYSQGQQRYFQSLQTNVKLISKSLLLQSNQVESFLKCLKFRTNKPKILVQIKHAEIKKQQHQYCKLLLFIENISLNLEQLMFVDFIDMLNILYFSIPAFSELLKFHGKYFTIDSCMIGFNDLGQLKVWLNRDYEKYQPKACYSYNRAGNKEQAQQNMVRELKQLFFCKVAKNSVTSDFDLQSKSFSDLSKQIGTKVGKQKLTNIFLDLIKLKNSRKGSVKPDQIRNRAITQNQDGKAPQIRFNYEQDKNSITKNIHFNYLSSNQTANLYTSQVTKIY